MKTKFVRAFRVLSVAAFATVVAASQAAYTITTYNYPGALSTQAWGINNALQVAANANLGPGIADGVGFVYTYGTGSISLLPAPAPGSVAVPLGINDAGVMVGGVNSSAVTTSTGFVLNGGTFALFNYPGAVSTYGRAINASGNVTGYYEDAVGNLGAYLYNPLTAAFTSITFPGSSVTFAQGSNSAGVIVGSAILPANGAYPGSPSGQYGYVRQSAGTVTFFRVNGRPTRARGINDAGSIVGWLNDVTPGETKGFVVTVPTGAGYANVSLPVTEYISVAGNPQTFAEGINNLGFISGSASDGVGGSIAFVAAPPAATLIANLDAVIDGFGLPRGLTNALGAKLDAALAALDAGNVTGACNNLQALINQANAQSGKKLTIAQANQIISAANAIRATLGCA